MTAVEKLSAVERQDFHLRRARVRSRDYSVSDYRADRQRERERWEDARRHGATLTGQAALNEWASA